MLLLTISGCESDPVPSVPIGITQVLNVPADFPSIQEAINTSRSGDTIRVAPGIYQENLLIDSKDLTLLGAGRGVSIIQGYITFRKTSQGSITGFTITQGTLSGLHLVESNITVSRNQIDLNVLSGIKIERSAGVVSDNLVLNNGEEGILIEDTSGMVIGSNTITNNKTDGITLNNSSPTIITNIVEDNGADGISIRGFDRFSAPLLSANSINRNGGVGHYDIICLGPNTNPTGSGNRFGDCLNCTECGTFAQAAGL